MLCFLVRDGVLGGCRVVCLGARCSSDSSEIPTEEGACLWMQGYPDWEQQTKGIGELSGPPADLELTQACGLSSDNNQRGYKPQRAFEHERSQQGTPDLFPSRGHILAPDKGILVWSSRKDWSTEEHFL